MNINYYQQFNTMKKITNKLSRIKHVKRTISVVLLFSLFSLRVFSQPLTANAGYTQYPSCSQQTVQLGGLPAATGGTGNYTYSWSPSTNLDDPNSSNPNLTVVSSASYSVTLTYTLTVTDDTMATSSSVVYIYIPHTDAVAEAGSDMSDCWGQTFNFEGAGSGTSFHWDFGDGGSTDLTTLTGYDYNYYAPGIYYAILTAYDYNGCSAKDTAIVHANGPTVNAGGDMYHNYTVCGKTVNFTGASTNATNFIWNMGDGNTSSVINPAYTYADYSIYGYYTATLYATDNDGCKDSASVTIYLNQIPVADAGADQTVCLGNTITLGGPNTFGQMTGWDFGDGNFGSGNTTDYTYTESGTFYAVISTGFDNNCGSANDTAIITVNQPVANAGSSSSGCVNNAVSFDGSASTGNNLTYNWDFGDGGVAYTLMPFHTYSIAGSFTATLTVTDSIAGCSSVAYSYVFINDLPIANAGTDQTVCFGTSVYLSGNSSGSIINYIWNFGDYNNSSGQTATYTYASPGTYYAVFDVVDYNGCSGIDTAIINVLPASTYTQNMTICEGNSITVGTSTYTISGTYNDVFVGSNTCDSTVTTNLTVRPAITGSKTMTLCAGGSVTVGTATHTTTGTFTDVLTSYTGCDSTVTTNLTVRPAITGTQTLAVCEGGSISVGTSTYTSSGTYTDMLTSYTGCDSTVTTYFTVNPLPAITANASSFSICSGYNVILSGGGAVSYSWTGGVTDGVAFVPASSGSYTVTGTDGNGCSNTASTSVTVNAPITGTQTMTVCAGGSVTVGTSTYTSTGTFTDVLTSYTGCDSTVTTNLTVRNAITGTQTMTVCAGGSVTVGTNTYTTSGTFTDILTSYTSCDSTVTTNLTVLPVITGTQTLTVCAGGSVTVGTNTYTTSGTFTDILTSYTSCDSTVTTNLTVLPAITGTQTMTVCAGGNITVGTATHVTTGTFTDILTSYTGCDSTVTTTLTVRPAMTGTQTMTICAGGNVTVGTSTYTSTGTYSDILTSYTGCDSTVTTNLTVRPAITGTQSMTVCAGGSVTVGTATHTTTGTFTDVLTSYTGCDSTVTTNLTVRPAITGTQTLAVCAGGSITVGTSTYTSSGTYTDILTSYTGCDSTVTTHFTVNPLPIITANASSYSICTGSNVTLSGGGAASYSWTGGVTDGVAFTPTSSGSYTVTGTDGNGCSNTTSTYIIVNAIPVVTANSSAATICPGSSVTLTGGGAANYVWTGGVTDGVAFAPAITGTYTVTGSITYTVSGTVVCSNTASTSVTVNAPITGTQTMTVCAGNGVTVGSTTHTTTGTFTDILTSYTGCDSTVTTNLTVRLAITGTQTITVCAGGSVTVGTATHTTTGTYTDVLTSYTGCDSTVTTNLTVSPAITGSQTMNVCAGGSVTVGSNTYTSTGTYNDLLLASNGCDSTVTTNLTVGPAITGSQTLTVCAGGSVTVGTSTYTSTGIFTDLLTSYTGCDSTVTTNLTVSPAITGSLTTTVCAGTSITVGSNTYTSTGVYTDIFTAYNGCDSTQTTNLTVRPAITGSQTMTVCAGGSVTVGTVTHTTTGTFTDILTSYTGCDSTVTTNLTVIVQLATATHTINTCFAIPNTLTATGGGGTYYWSPSPGLNTTTGTSVTANPTISTTYYVTDTISGCAMIDSTTITVNPLITVDAGPHQSLCLGTTATLFATATGGTGTYNYYWNNGTANYTTDTVTLVPTTNVTFTLTVTDAAACSATDTVTITSRHTDIYGKVTYSAGILSHGHSTAVLYRWANPYIAQFDTLAVSSIDTTTGYYHFSNVYNNNLLVKVFPDTIAYHNVMVSSYYNATHPAGLWDSTNFFTHTCNAVDTLNIVMIEQQTYAGPGRISGRVTKGPNYQGISITSGSGRNIGDPVPGLDVKAGHNPGGQLITSTTTTSLSAPDGGGYFYFDHLPLDSCIVIYVDIPGLKRDSTWSVCISATDTVYTNLNYIADSSDIYYLNPNTSVAEIKGNANNLTVYPNPFMEDATIEYAITKDAAVKLEVYTMLGDRLQTLVNASQPSGKYKYNLNAPSKKLSSGVYFIKLSVGESTSTQRIIVME